jgi:hypothetical protein
VIRLLGEKLDDQLDSEHGCTAHVRQLLIRSIASGVAPGMTCAKSCRRVMGKERWGSAWRSGMVKGAYEVLF